MRSIGKLVFSSRQQCIWLRGWSDVEVCFMKGCIIFVDRDGSPLEDYPCSLNDSLDAFANGFWCHFTSGKPWLGTL